MNRNEQQTCRELIEPALKNAGWQWERQVVIGPGRVNISGDAMYDDTQAIIADYVLRYRGVPLAVLEAKAESSSAADAIQQGSRYSRRLAMRGIVDRALDLIWDVELGSGRTIPADWFAEWQYNREKGSESRWNN